MTAAVTPGRNSTGSGNSHSPTSIDVLQPYDCSDQEGDFDGARGGGGGGSTKPHLSDSLPARNLFSLHSTQAYERVAEDEDDETPYSTRDAPKVRRRGLVFVGVSAVVALLLLATVHFSRDDNRESSRDIQTLPKDGCSCQCDATASHYESVSDPSKEDLSSSRHYDDANAQATYDGPYRAFDPWEGDFPCYEPPTYSGHKWKTNEPRNIITDGFFYVKVPKTGSSTLSGITLRIAHRKGREMLGGPHKVCNVEEAHGSAYKRRRYDKLDKTKSFLYSFIRDPTQRSISFYFYKEVSRLKNEPTDSNFLNWTRHGCHGTFQMDYLKLVDHHESLNDAVDNILSNYNFAGITERLDESLVVLQMLLGLETTDVLFTSSKTAGGFAYVHNDKNPRCIYATQKFVSPKMKMHFKSKEWLHKIRGDAKLYAAVNRSLDATIERLGRSEFEVKLQLFREAQALALERCADTVVNPCSAGGELVNETNCYEADKGCGYLCLDEVADELDKARRQGGSKL